MDTLKVLFSKETPSKKKQYKLQSDSAGCSELSVPDHNHVM